MMLGFGSLETALAFWCSILATCVCIAWGLWNWNEKGNPETHPLQPRKNLPKSDTP